MFEGTLYEFTCLPNGLSSGPRIFTKVMRAALTHLRTENDVTISGYLDDNLLVNYDDVIQGFMKGKVAAEKFQKLGFAINIPKSVADAGVTKIEHLGVVIDSVLMRATLSEKKTGKLVSAIQGCLDKPKISIRELASVKGRIEATKPANPYAPLWSKRLEIAKISALQSNSYNYEARIVLSQDCREDLMIALQNLPGVSAPIRIPPPDYTIFSDASELGYGFHDPGADWRRQRGGGRWSQDEEGDHINVLELKAAYFALKSLCDDKENIHLRMMTDNTTAMYCVNKLGSTRVKLNDLTHKIWLFAMERDIWLSSGYVPGRENLISDEESRNFDENIEWTLREDIFQYICQLFGTPNIDLFASRLNFRVPKYVSWHPDPEAFSVDSFNCYWGSEFIYAFPPFCLVHKVIQKCIQDGAEGILIVPNWPSQPWFTLLHRFCVDKPFDFTVYNDELFLPFRSDVQVHPLSRQGQGLRMRAVSFKANRI